MVSDPVVITGMGAVTCLGVGLSGFWDGLTAGHSGIGPIRKFDVSGIRNPEAGLAYEWDRDGMPGWAAAMDESTQFALSAAREAVRHAGLDTSKDSPVLGVVLATNFGGARHFEGWAGQGDDPTGPPLAFSNSLPQAATDATAALLHAAGPRISESLSCSSGAAAIGTGAEWVALGRADVIVAGGYDALSLYALAGLSCLRTVTTGRLQPFDRNRSGTVFGEGAGIVVLEKLSHARARGVEPIAVVSGWATNNNAHHLTAPDSEGTGLLKVMQMACVNAALDPDDIDYVNAHGTGTRYNDPSETRALHHLLGDRAFAVPVSGIKAAISHTMGAAGSLEAIATVMAIRTGIVPPTLNWEERDPECDLDYVPNEARAHSVRCALSLSSGLGGNNAALLLEAP